MSKKISVTTLKALKAQANKTTQVCIGEVDGNEITTEIKNYLSMEDFCKFTGMMKEAIDAGYHEDAIGTTVFLPENVKIQFTFCLLIFYAPGINLPADPADAYTMIQALGLDSLVLDVVQNTNQFAQICATLRDYARFAGDLRRNARSLDARLGRLLDMITEKVSALDMESISENLLDGVETIKAIHDASPESLQTILAATGLDISETSTNQE